MKFVSDQTALLKFIGKLQLQKPRRLLFLPILLKVTMKTPLSGKAPAACSHFCMLFLTFTPPAILSLPSWPFSHDSFLPSLSHLSHPGPCSVFPKSLHLFHSFTVLYDNGIQTISLPWLISSYTSLEASRIFQHKYSMTP